MRKEKTRRIKRADAIYELMELITKQLQSDGTLDEWIMQDDLHFQRLELEIMDNKELAELYSEFADDDYVILN